MGMRKKIRNKMKATWKVEKVKRDQNKLKRAAKMAAQGIAPARIKHGLRNKKITQAVRVGVRPGKKVTAAKAK